MGEYVCPIMKCEGTDTERSVLPIAGCHIYIYMCLFVCVCVSMCVFVGDGYLCAPATIVSMCVR